MYKHQYETIPLPQGPFIDPVPYTHVFTLTCSLFSAVCSPSQGTSLLSPGPTPGLRAPEWILFTADTTRCTTGLPDCSWPWPGQHLQTRAKCAQTLQEENCGRGCNGGVRSSSGWGIGPRVESELEPERAAAQSMLGLGCAVFKGLSLFTSSPQYFYGS